MIIKIIGGDLIKLNLFMAIILLTGLIEAATISVEPGHSIQAAIDAANQSDVIEIQKGTYYENVNVVKKVVLKGVNNPIVNANDIGDALTISSNGVAIEGLILTNSSASSSGINVSNISRDCILKGNTIAGNKGNGVDLWATENISILGNIIIKNEGNGIGLWSCDKTKLMNNILINNNGSGVFGGTVNSSIKANTVSANGDSGIVLLNAFDIIIANNEVSSNNKTGVMLILGSNSSIAGNTINNNGNSGISLLFSWKNIVSNNIVKENFEGIFLGNSSENNLVSGNIIKYNQLGIHLVSSSNNIILNNELTNNIYDAFDDGNNKWDSLALGGKY
jgi:parallel beta-helix repeat protein